MFVSFLVDLIQYSGKENQQKQHRNTTPNQENFNLQKYKFFMFLAWSGNTIPFNTAEQTYYFILLLNYIAFFNILIISILTIYTV